MLIYGPILGMELNCVNFLASLLAGTATLNVFSLHLLFLRVKFTLPNNRPPPFNFAKSDRTIWMVITDGIQYGCAKYTLA